MLVSEAHSLSQQSRLAITLAWIAGYTNAATILCSGLVSSHVSGTTSNLGIEIVLGQWSLAFVSFFLLCCFGVGAAIAGLATEWGRTKAWESLYVFPIAIETVLLALFAISIEFIPGEQLRDGTYRYLVVALAAAAMGVQNATITRISGGVVRTTHVTGVLTDLGIETAHYLTRRKSPLPGTGTITLARLVLLLGILGSFAFGAGLGTLSHEAFPRFTMFPPVFFLLGVILIDLTRPIAEIGPVTLALLSQLEVDQVQIGVYQVRPDSDRRSSGRHRIPNLTNWAARLPIDLRKVILDLSSAPQLDENALLEILRLADSLLESRKQLVLCGLSASARVQIDRQRLDQKKPPVIHASSVDAALS